MSFINKIKSALQKTSDKISSAIINKKLDVEFIQELEDTLIMADVGVESAVSLSQKVANKKFSPDASASEIKHFLASEIELMLKNYESNFLIEKFSHIPEVILVIGVNGNGKTTTVAKIANILKNAQYSPIMIAADTFRAAAVEQLMFWAEKLDMPICSSQEKIDPAALVYQGMEIATQNNNDVVLIDTAGRMQNREDLLAELEKIKRVIKKYDVTAPHKTILIIDGLTGQAAHNQVDVFLNKIGIDGIIVTKLDGTAKGGALIALTTKYKLPIFALGIGEELDDLKSFNAASFSKALLDL